MEEQTLEEVLIPLFLRFIFFISAYRSDDVGKSWKFISSGFPYPSQWNTQGIAVHPNNADHILLALGNSFTSTDPGQGEEK